MIEFRTLGGLDVRDANGEPIAGAFSRPKPLALLAYLALARPRGFHQQDALLALFWPESDTDRARASLRQAVHVLRRTLGDDVVVRRGRQELGLDGTRLCCDAVLFEQAAAAGDAERALALYRGELLPAYYVPDAPDAERWLDGERARLRSIALDAVRTEVDRATDPATVVRWTRRAIAIAPDDDTVVRRALQTLEHAGAIAPALALYDEWIAARDRAESGPPSTRLQQIAQRLRATRVTTPAAGSAAAASAPAAVDADSVDTPAADADDRALAVRRPASPATASPEPAPADPAPAESPRTALVEAAPAVAPEATSAPPAPADPALDRTVPTRPRVRRVPRRRWPVVAVALTVAAVGTATVYARRVPAVAPSPAPVVARAATPAMEQRVVVLPFVVRGGNAAAYLRDALVELLSTKIDGVAGVTAVDPRTLLTYVARTERDSVRTPDDVAQGQEIARHFGAGQFVLGSVIAAGGRLEATATLYDADGRRRASATAVGGSEAALFAVADQLARELLGAEVGGPDAHFARVATATTTSLAALKAFLEGEADLRGRDRDAAAEAYERAVRADSTFALAYYRLSTTASWRARPELVRFATEQARRYAERLPRAERLLLRGNAASSNGASEDAEGLYQAVLAAAPDMVEASRQLGEVRFHLGPWRGRPLATARDAFEHVVSIDSTDVNARLHLARIAALSGQRARVDSLVTQALALDAEPGMALELRTLGAAMSGDQGALRRALDAVRGAVGRPTPDNDDAAWLVAWRVGTFSDDPAIGRLLAGVLANPGAAPHVQLLGHTAAAHMLAAGGRWAAADAELGAAAQIDASYAAQVRANLALIATLAPDRHVAGVLLAHARSALTAVPEPTAPGGTAGLDTATTVGDRVVHDRDAFFVVRRAYLLGALALAVGDSAEVQRNGRTLAGASRLTGPAGQLARHLAHQLSARARWARGDLAGALADVEQGWPGADHSTALPLFRGETYTQAVERVFRGDLLRAMGRDREALAWYESATEDLGATVALSAFVHLRRAEANERLGDTAAAATQYRRVVAMWADADPGLQAVARGARQRAAALQPLIAQVARP